MPFRRIFLAKNQIYHLFNRGAGKQIIFREKRDYARALEVMGYYQYAKPDLRFSYYDRLQKEEKDGFLEELKRKGEKQIEFLTYCLIPNHYHLVAKELEDNGIINFMHNYQESYAKYYNAKYKRKGAMFESNFKAVRIETDEQFLHVCRYVHLNPYTTYLVKKITELEDYTWSSFPDYLGKREPFLTSIGFLMGFFKGVEKLKSFTFDQADYQRRLEELKHFALD